MNRKTRRGLTLVEAMMGVTVLATTVVTASALLPATALLRDRAAGYSRAAGMAQRKLEQVRKLDPARITTADLRSRGIVDTNYEWISGTTGVYAFTSRDSVAQELRSGAGYLVFTGLGLPVVRVDVFLFWRGFNGRYYSQVSTTQLADKSAWREP